MVATPVLVKNDAFIRPLNSLDRSDIPIVGGKNANLGELLQHLTTVGVRVPDGFALVADAFRQHLREAHLDEQIYATLDRLDLRDVAALARAGRTDRAIMYRAERGYPHRAVALSVGVQKMVRSDLASAGVIFTLDPETGFRDVVHHGRLGTRRNRRQR